MMKHQYKISGMTCQSCVSKVTKALEEVEGIKEASVTLDPPIAQVTMDSHVPTAKLNEQLKKAGNYTIQEADQATHSDSQSANVEEETDTSYKPLVIVIAYLLLAVAIQQINQGYFEWRSAMNLFMGGFFIAFSFFKMLDIQAFAHSFASYDIITKKWIGYGYAYPFIELLLGIAYLTHFAPTFTYSATIIILGISSIGVFQSVANKRKIQCACLGTVFNLPMSTVTIIEDIAMLIMALIMLFVTF